MSFYLNYPSPQRGACSEVRAGTLKSDGTLVAVKIITGQLCEIVPRSNWSTIATNLRKCASDRVVKLLDNFEDDEGVYLVLERFGCKLSQCSSLRIPFTLVSALQSVPQWNAGNANHIVAQILEATQTVHAAGLIHGDISVCL